MKRELSPLAATVAIVLTLVVLAGGWFLFTRHEAASAVPPKASFIPKEYGGSGPNPAAEKNASGGYLGGRVGKTDTSPKTKP